ncbi:DNA excision repair protein ERCC-8 [Phlyctochytrium planicorne]|nr:DNA excision repair protein ERCC-8 [Phlyctochytrium planicorne]
MLAGFADSSIRIFDLSNTVRGKSLFKTVVKPVATIHRKEAHHFSVSSVVWYPVDNGIFVSGSMDCMVKVWDANSLEVACTIALDQKVNSLAFSPISTNHTLLAAATTDTNVKLCDLRNGTMSNSLVGHRMGVYSVAWSPIDEYILVSGSLDSTMSVWDIRNQRKTMHVIDPRLAPQALLSNATLESSASSGLSAPSDLSSSGKRTRDGQVKGKTSSDAKISKSIRSAPVNGLCFDRDGKRLVSMGHDCQVRAWDAKNWEHINTQFPMVIQNKSRACMHMSLQTFDSGNGQSATIAFVPCEDETITMFDLDSGAKLKTLYCHWGKVTCLAARPTVQELYSGGWDEEILCWTPSFIPQPIGVERTKVFGDEFIPQVIEEKAPGGKNKKDKETGKMDVDVDGVTETKRGPVIYRIPDIPDDDIDIEADELDAFCLHYAHKELSNSSLFHAKLFPQTDSATASDDLDEVLGKMSVDDRELRDRAVWEAARVVADRAVSLRLLPRRLSLKNLFISKSKSGIYDKLDVVKDLDGSITSFIEADAKPVEKSDVTSKLSVDGHSYRGLKPTNEDRFVAVPDASLLFSSPEKEKYVGVSVFGVFDGHGGEACADYIRTYLHLNVLRHEKFFEDIPLALKESFVKTNDNYKRCLTRESENTNAGSTGTLAVFYQNKAHVAWAGDSPAFLLTDAGTSSFLLDPPHNSSVASERRRVEALGGVFLKDNDTYRLNGSLSVTRSFGDFRISCMTAEPDVVSVSLVPEAKQEDGSKSEGQGAGATWAYRYFVVSSDGLTDVMTPVDVWKAIRVKEDPSLGDVLGTFSFDDDSKVEEHEGGESNLPSVEEQNKAGFPERATQPTTSKIPLGTCEYITQASVDFKNSSDNVTMIVEKRWSRERRFAMEDEVIPTEENANDNFESAKRPSSGDWRRHFALLPSNSESRRSSVYTSRGSLSPSNSIKRPPLDHSTQPDEALLVSQLEDLANSRAASETEKEDQSRQNQVGVTVGSPGYEVDSAIGSSLETMAPVHPDHCAIQPNFSQTKFGRDEEPSTPAPTAATLLRDLVPRMATPTVVVSQDPEENGEDVGERRPIRTDSMATMESERSGKGGRSRRARPVTWSAGSGHFDYFPSFEEQRDEDEFQPITKSDLTSSAPVLGSPSKSPTLGRSRSRSNALPTPIIVSTNFGAMVIGMGDDDDEGNQDSGESVNEEPLGTDGARSPVFDMGSASVPSPVGSQRTGNDSRSDAHARALSSCSESSSKVSLGPMQTRFTEAPLPKEMDSFFRELEDMLADANRQSSPSSSECATAASTPCLYSDSRNLSVHRPDSTFSLMPRAWSLPHGELFHRSNSTRLNPNRSPSNASSGESNRSRAASASRNYLDPNGSTEFRKDKGKETCPWESIESLASTSSSNTDSVFSFKSLSRSMPSLAGRREGASSNGQLNDRLFPSRENSRSKERKASASGGSLEKVNLLAGLTFPRSLSLSLAGSSVDPARDSDRILKPEGELLSDSAYGSAETGLADSTLLKGEIDLDSGPNNGFLIEDDIDHQQAEGAKASWKSIFRV